MTLSTASTPPDYSLLQALSPQQREALAQAIQAKLNTRRLDLYEPYPKQREFHEAGATHRERLFMAGNQLGKTIAGSFEVAMHATGKYPAWWKGRRFEKPTTGWVAGVTSETTRDNVQRLLLGRPGDYGTGSIPGKSLVGTVAARGVADLVDTVTVRHTSGGLSRIMLKTYEKGREKWQGETLDYVWFDEEPPSDIYTEGLTRTNATGGFVFLTFTPLLGMSDVVMRFLSTTRDEGAVDRSVTTMTIDDAPHYTPEQRRQIIASYPAHEREARAKGIPTLGSGRVFPVAEDKIAVESFEIPKHWAQIGGIDFGWDHPTAGVKLAWDRDTDTVYVAAAYRVREATPLIHAAALKEWGNLTWAWPHDGLQHDKGSGEQLAEQYRKHGLTLTVERATFQDGSNGVEAGVMDMLDRMETGRLKVFRHLSEWLEEFRLYHREDGKIVKERDDLLSATRYALMMLRFASPLKASGWSSKLEYSNKGIV